MGRRAALVLLLAALVCTTPRAAPALVNNGELRVLVIMATWGPQPFTRAAVQDVVFKQSDAFVRDNSFGAARLAGEVTPWVKAFPAAPACGTPTEQKSLATAAQAAAKAAGFDVASYTRFIYLFPFVDTCGYGGYGSLTEVFLNGQLSRGLVTHELGHTFGLQHAHMEDCSAGGCQSIEYGDPFDTMGQSLVGEYNAYEKFVAGWLKNVTRNPPTGNYVIDQLELPSKVPQALDISTAKNEYWFDHREPLLSDAAFASNSLVRGLEVHAGPPSSDPTAQSDFDRDNTLLPNPSGHGAVILPGDVFSERGAFRLTVTAHTGTQIAVRFEWTDTTRPSKPSLSRPGRPRVNRSFVVRWEPSTDSGSGVDHYAVSLDGRAVRNGRRRLQAADAGRRARDVSWLAHAARRGLRPCRKQERRRRGAIQGALTGSTVVTSTVPRSRVISRGSKRPPPSSSVAAAPVATAARSASGIGSSATRAAR